MERVSIRSVAISCFLFAAPSFAAADKALCSFDDGSLVVFGDIGVAKIKAQEFFCVGDQFRKDFAGATFKAMSVSFGPKGTF
ncbi:hypothetical protein GOL30_32005 [Sinorhizobium medicae]|uniref:hypothetical protein n=1 Tax=Sinorhizobium medicae TaxID=110321 RepID=UPI000FD9384B|nr:hypothetical protein [Sinorhizobium medicae]MBO1944986.1 hypothetical protein [Sinorhizobium medicae]MBO1945020.1 hypothetical protein [Sinorhizobium medicae]MDX0414548.1 hypothetical protein [Sinorhizobium medicae]MDX0433348.1 hypothetical protein [Sinorhizobium medicae]MDX0439755.1 hypothetical protein [Sinorhizobium medicae]